MQHDNCDESAFKTTHPPKIIAFYLTQYHPIPENNIWWGKGFTEWTNVTKAESFFEGHYQPHHPTDLGFYDLRVRETRHEQIALAKQYGIDAFCYHYYWFSGKRLLEKPLFDMLEDKDSNMPFCLCWANENWTRRWDGAESKVLIKQDHSENDDVNFIKDIAAFLSDERYITLDGKKFIIIYRPQDLPDPQRTLNKWRSVAREMGLGELHICAALTFGNQSYKKYGCDSGVEFPPHNLEDTRPLNGKIRFKQPFSGLALPYDKIATEYLNKSYPEPDVFRTVFPSWDNTARRHNQSNIVLNSTPENYRCWLSRAITWTKSHFKGRDSIVFINAWNEWAEGCHLEPDRKHGHAYLEATYAAKLDEKSYLYDFPHVDLNGYATNDTFRAHWEQFCYSPLNYCRTLAFNILNRFPRVKAILKGLFSLIRVIKLRLKHKIISTLRKFRSSQSL